MHLTRAAEQLFGENTGRLLHRLAAVSDELTGRRIADLAGVPVTSASRVLAELEGVGLVHSRAMGPSRLYRLNRRHVLWDPIEAILAAPARIVEVAQDAVRGVLGDRATLAAFGSFARGDAAASSDIDLLLVWDDHVTSDEVDTALEVLNTDLWQATGNRVEVVALHTDELARLVHSDDPLVESWRRDARTLTGMELTARLATASK
jgi:UTP:GlnB (protein PII) uridylyltransferase